MTDPLTPTRLFELTTEYHDFGHHRTGTTPDIETADWFFGHLADLGAAVERHQIDFPRYQSRAELIDADGRAIPCEPVFYEFDGRHDGSAFEVAVVSVQGTGSAAALDELLHRRSGPLVIVVDGGPPGLRVMPNRPVDASDRPPAVVVPSDAQQRLESATLTVEAELVPGRCESSSAVIGAGPPVTVTTPLSGWFGCASERGSGAAIALDLVARLAATNTVTVVAGSGHELAHLGLQAWLDRASAASAVPRGPVIHLGASIGAAQHGVLESRIVIQGTEARAEWIDELRAVVAPANYRVATLEDPWPGEGHNWRAHTPNVLSFTGAGRWFHTTGDTPEQATTPAALAVARDAVWDATRRFIDRTS